MWTYEHLVTLLPAVGVYIVIAFVFALLLRNKKEIIRMIPTMVIGTILFGLEVAKQVYSIKTGYSYWILPFHFCSQFFWMIPLMAFYHGKHKYMVRSVATTASMMLFLFLMLYPQSIYGAASIRNYNVDFLSFHTVTFHNLVILNLFIVIALDINEFKFKRDTIANIVVFGLYCALGGIMSQVLKTNYNNFYTNRVEWVENFRLSLIDKLGQFGQPMYLIMFSVLIVIGSIFSNLVLRMLCRLCAKHKKS